MGLYFPTRQRNVSTSVRHCVPNPPWRPASARRPFEQTLGRSSSASPRQALKDVRATSPRKPPPQSRNRPKELGLDVPGLTEAVVQVLVVVSRNGQHEQIRDRYDDSSRNNGDDQHVEAKITHGASRDGRGGSTARGHFLLRKDTGARPPTWVTRSPPDRCSSADRDTSPPRLRQSRGDLLAHGKPFMAVHPDRTRVAP